MSFRRPVSRRKSSSAVTASISVSLPAGAVRSNQARKRVTRGAVAQMRRARAGDLGCVLDRLHHRDRIGSARDLAAARADQPLDGVGGGGRIEPDGAARRAECREVGGEGVRLAQIGDVGESVADGVGQLAAVDIERRAALRRHDGEGERDRGMGDVGAADVEQPADRVRIGDDQRVGAGLGDFGCRPARAWRSPASPAKRSSCRLTAPSGGRRAVRPDRVERIGVRSRPASAPAAAQALASLSAPSIV